MAIWEAQLQPEVSAFLQVERTTLSRYTLKAIEESENGQFSDTPSLLNASELEIIVTDSVVLSLVQMSYVVGSSCS